MYAGNPQYSDSMHGDAGCGQGEVMTLQEVASYLRLAEKTVLRMVHKGQIPCAKVASQWRFLRSMIDDWLIAKMRVVPRTDLARLIESTPEVVPLSRLLRIDQVVPDILPGSKEEVLRQLVQPLLKARFIDSERPFLDKLLERERIVSTAVGRGVAIPHLRNPQDNPGGGPLLTVGICREGTDFEAPDGERTHLFFLLSTDSEVVHLRVLAKVNRIAGRKDTMDRLVAAASSEEIIEELVKAEQGGS
jgi:PTS system nitrogen regulatory IIA component